MPGSLIPLLRQRTAPALDFNFANMTTLDPRLTQTQRASNAMMFNAAGQLVWAPANMCKDTEDCTAASWSDGSTLASRSNGGASVAPSAGIALRMTENSANSAHFMQHSTAIACVAGQQYFVKFLFRPDTRVKCIFSFGSTWFGTNSVEFDCTNPASPTATPSGSISAATIAADPLASGWYICTACGLCATAGSANLQFYLKAATQSYVGDGISGAWIAAPQCEPYGVDSPKSYVQVTGTAGYFGNRFDYDPSTLSAIGLLLEEARTNTIKDSENFSAVSWTNTNVTVGALVSSPWSMTNATTLTAAAGNATLVNAITTTAASWTFSIFLKRKTGTGNVQISMDGVTWVTQTINSTTWTRCVVTQTCSAGTTSPGLKIVTNADAVYAIGAVAEAGSHVTSYIPTYGATATRAADSTPYLAISPAIASRGMSIVAEASIPSMPNTLFPVIAALNASTSTITDEFYLFTNGGSSTSNTNVRIDAGGVQQTGPSTIAATISSIRAGATMNAKRCALSVNGSAVTTSNIATSPAAMAYLIMGRNLNAAVAQARWLKRVRVWNKPLMDAQLQALTS